MHTQFVRVANGTLVGSYFGHMVTLEREDTTEPYEMFFDGLGVSAFEGGETREEAEASARRALASEFAGTVSVFDDAQGEA